MADEISYLQKTCEMLAENSQLLLLDEAVAVLKEIWLPLVISFIGIPLVVFIITSAIINPGRGKIKFNQVVWSYLMSGVITIILSITSFLMLVNLG